MPRAPRDPAVEGFAHPAAGTARIVPVLAGDHLLSVNPVDGSEIALRPPGGAPGDQDWPEPPRRRTEAERAAHDRAGQPPVPAGPAAPPVALVERDEIRERLTGLLRRGRSVRLSGPPGSGRTALLDLVAQDCAGLAPDGVIRLNGAGRTAADLLYALYATVYRTDRYRPDRAELLAHVAGIGAVVVLDDLETSDRALDDLLDSAPECAFLVAARPAEDPPEDDARGPLADRVELEGLSRAGALRLLTGLVGRELTEDERNWAGDLWFESEGLPLRFVQAGALLRQYDALRADAGAGAANVMDDADDADDAAEDVSPFQAPASRPVRLPTLGQGAAPAALLASRLSESARETLRFAVALGGEVPHQAHLPALIGDTHADTALGELTGCGLLSPAGSRYRLAPGALDQLKEKGYGADGADPVEAGARAHTAAGHYAWWTAHPSVTAERVAVEADAVLATLSALLTDRVPGHISTAVRLARAAAPVFAAGLHWTAWESALRMGSEAARIAGEVAEEAYFHHELGVLALCTERLGRARAELEASIALRGALADKNGTVAGRRALALVTDRETRGAGPAALAAAPEHRAIGPGGPARPQLVPVPVPVAVPPPAAPVADEPPAPLEAWPQVRSDDHPPLAVSSRPPLSIGGGAAISEPLTVPQPVIGAARTPGFGDERPGKPRGRRPGRRLGVLLGARRNLVAAGAGAVIVAALGTFLTIAPVSDEKAPTTRVGTGESATEDGTREEPPRTTDAETDDTPGTVDPTRSASRVPTAPSASREAPESPRPTRSTAPQQPGPSRSAPSRPSRPGSSAPTSRPPSSSAPASSKPPSSAPPASSKPPTASQSPPQAESAPIASGTSESSDPPPAPAPEPGSGNSP
ncbi:ATP-binding protein [Streptomyces sp. NPDC006798]|uniref:ATP-binding protein n=1 Tax=Streptomyces sp. NPDC006798 TaxID=3155462 RepID=UPI0033CCF310